MAWTRARIELEQPCEEIFPRVADFSQAEVWDPGVVRGQKLTEGPVRIGTEFEIVARFLGQDVALRYRVTELRPPHRIVLEAESTWLRSVDTIVCEPAREGGCALSYEAHLVPKGILYVGDLGLQLAFQWIGRKAIRGLAQWLRQAPPAPSAHSATGTA